MHKGNFWPLVLAGGLAGAVNGLFGAGGGMVLVPLLTCLTDVEEGQVFPCSIAVILPICLVSLMGTPLPWKEALPYLLGGGFGGIAAGLWGQKIPVKWLHRVLGILILWGGIRWICS